MRSLWILFWTKTRCAALKDKSSSGTEPEPTNKTWTVIVTKAGATTGKVITYKLTDGGEDQTVSKYDLVGESDPKTGFSFDITAPEKPTIFSVTYDSETISSGITVAEKQQ